MIFLSLLFAIVFVVFLLAINKYHSLTSAFLSGYLFFVSHIVFVFLIANTFHSLANLKFILCLQSIMAAISIFAWLLRGRPRLFINILQFSKSLRLKSVYLKVKTWPLISILVSGVGFTYIFYLLLVWFVPPNNSDSMHTHLSRLGYWLQHGSFFPWPTFNTKQLFYPINISLQVYWTILFERTDKLAGYIQWMGAIISIVAVYGIALLLNAKRPQALFSAMLWASFPIILFQSTSTQLDLSSACLFLIAIYFLIQGIKKDSKTSFIFSGLALALALGAKQTIFFMLPGLVIFLILQWKYWRGHLNRFLIWSSATLGFFIILSSYIYVVNYLNYGNIAGPKEIVAESTGSGLENMISSIPRLIYQSIDFSGLPKSVISFGNRGKAKIMETIQKYTGVTLETNIGNAIGHQFKYRDYYEPTEDSAWFGIISVLLLFPVMIIELIKAIKHKNSIILGLILLSVSFLPINAYLRPGWDPYQGRYFIMSVGLITPLLYVYINKKSTSIFIQIIAVVLAAFSMIEVTLFNPSKPIKNPVINIFTADRMTLQSLSAGKTLWNLDYMLSRSLPEDAVIGYYSQKQSYDYPLFGEYFTRTVIPITDIKLLSDVTWLKTNGIQYVLVNVSEGFPENISPKLVPYDEVKGSWMMYTWSRVK